MSYRFINWFVFFTIFVLLGLNIFQYTRNPSFNNNQKQIEEVINVNGLLFDNCAKLTQIVFDNTDTMMRFTHFLDKHDPSVGQVLACPECGEHIPSTIPAEATVEPDYPLTDVPVSLTQVLEDAHELNANLGRLIFSAINQDVALRITLERMRDPGANVDNLYKQIYKPLSEYGIEEDL